MSSFKSCHLACRPPFLQNLSEHGGGQFLSLPHNNINFPDSKNVRWNCPVIQIYRVSFSATDKSDKFHHQLLLIPLPTTSSCRESGVLPFPPSHPLAWVPVESEINTHAHPFSRGITQRGTSGTCVGCLVLSTSKPVVSIPVPSTSHYTVL